MRAAEFFPISVTRKHIVDQYRHSPPSVFERYAMGLEDGRALIRLG